MDDSLGMQPKIGRMCYLSFLPFIKVSDIMSKSSFIKSVEKIYEFPKELTKV